MTETAPSILAHTFQTGATVTPGGSLVLDHPAELPFKGGERVTVIITPSHAEEEASDGAITSKLASEAMTPHERAAEFRCWAESHRRNTPLLSDDAVSRKSMYEERL